MNLTKLREARAETWAKMLAIQAGAGATLTIEQRTAWDRLERQLQDQSGDIERAERTVDYSQVIDARGGYALDGATEYRAGEPLRSGQSVAGYVRSRGLVPSRDGYGDDEPLSLRKALKGVGKLADTTGQPLAMPSYIADLPRYVTNQVPGNLTVGTSTDTSDVFVADWRQLVVGVRTELQLTVLTERYADNGQVGIVAWWRGYTLVARPKAFHVTTGVRP